jgi:hypothetical protein
VNEKQESGVTRVQGEQQISSRPQGEDHAGLSAGSLSLLKANPKKDKGPSAENLSSLRAALEASLANAARKGDEGSMPSKKYEPTPVRKTPQFTEPKKQQPLLEELSHPLPPKEVPEDVLNGLLADE